MCLPEQVKLMTAVPCLHPTGARVGSHHFRYLAPYVCNNEFRQASGGGAEWKRQGVYHMPQGIPVRALDTRRRQMGAAEPWSGGTFQKVRG